MKNIIIKSVLALTAASSLGLGAVAFAQSSTPSTPPPAPPASNAPAAPQAMPAARPGAGWHAMRRQAMRRNRMRWLAHRLQLTEPQRAAALHIHAKAMADIWAARADETLTRDQRVARIRASVEAGRAAFINVLTPDQRAKLDEIESRRERRLLGL